MPVPDTAAVIDRATSFGLAAEAYDRSRPSPPRSALQWMLSGDEAAVLDLAAGTGQITRQLDDRTGLDVVAVEPDPAMRAVRSRRCPDVRVFDGTAERIPLDDNCVDTVAVGSAWHWLNHRPAVPEVARILRAGGRLAVVGVIPGPSHPWVGAVFGDCSSRYARGVGAVSDSVMTPPDGSGPLRFPKGTTDIDLSEEDVWTRT